MQVNTSSSQSSGAPSTSKTSGTGGSLDYDSFLKLFMAEMKNHVTRPATIRRKCPRKQPSSLAVLFAGSSA